MERRFAEMFASALKTLEFCRVQASENMVIFTDTATSLAARDAFHAAALAIGSEATVVTMTARPVMLSNPPEPAIRALMEADMAVDLTTNSWLYTDATNRVLGAGTRMLQVLVGDDSVIARPPTAKIAERETKSRALLESCKEFRITSSLGTDIVLRRGDRPVHTQGGFVDHPGDWDSLSVCLARIRPTRGRGRWGVGVGGYPVPPARAQADDRDADQDLGRKGSAGSCRQEYSPRATARRLAAVLGRSELLCRSSYRLWLGRANPVRTTGLGELLGRGEHRVRREQHPTAEGPDDEQESL